jgi:DNA (cytosine-5)-methyltransferase 1
MEFCNTVASLFCGAGGLDLGFKGAGFDLVYACDNDPAAIDCYKRNIDRRALCEMLRHRFSKKK